MKRIEPIVIEIVKSLVPETNRHIVSPQCRLVEDLNLDSVQMLNLALQLEQRTKFDLLTSAADLTSIKTVSDVIQLVENEK